MSGFTGKVCVLSTPEFKKMPYQRLARGGMRGLGWTALGIRVQGGGGGGGGGGYPPMKIDGSTGGFMEASKW